MGRERDPDGKFAVTFSSDGGVKINFNGLWKISRVQYIWMVRSRGNYLWRPTCEIHVCFQKVFFKKSVFFPPKMHIYIAGIPFQEDLAFLLDYGNYVASSTLCPFFLMLASLWFAVEWK